jgi:molybdopterin-guanine dinucleotide biosynthesis protein A
MTMDPGRSPRAEMRPAIGVTSAFNSQAAEIQAIASATFRVLAKGDLDGDAAFASAVDCPLLPRSLTAPPATALRPEGPCCPRVRRGRDCPTAAASGGADRVESWLLA